LVGRGWGWLKISLTCELAKGPLIFSLPTVVLVFPGSATVVVNSGFPTVTVPAGQELTYQVQGGVLYERKIEIDRINGYLINQVQSNANGIFPIDRLGLYTITVTGANGCKRTVQGIITTAPGR